VINATRVTTAAAGKRTATLKNYSPALRPSRMPGTQKIIGIETLPVPSHPVQPVLPIGTNLHASRPSSCIKDEKSFYMNELVLAKPYLKKQV
jgi:hypothetical protein